MSLATLMTPPAMNPSPCFSADGKDRSGSMSTLVVDSPITVLSSRSLSADATPLADVSLDSLAKRFEVRVLAKEEKTRKAFLASRFEEEAVNAMAKLRVDEVEFIVSRSSNPVLFRMNQLY
jgi:hypothetical protein